jgi:hypothetical protein
MSQIEKTQALARQCAADACEAAGTSPYDVDGTPLIPTEPQDGDWAALCHLHSEEGWGHPRAGDIADFALCYKRAMVEIAAEYWEPKP